MPDCDVAIIGGGCVGLSIASHLCGAGDLSVTVFEKEPDLARHQSGRNSGVLHPGFNYPPGSLKARFAVEGTRRFKAFAAEHDVAVDACGVLVVATDDTDEANLEALFGRAEANGVDVERLESPDAIADIEPHAAGQQALWCPAAAAVDAPAYVRALARQVERRGGTVELATPVTDLERHGDGVTVHTDDNTVTATHLVNAAGVYADRFAHTLGVGQDYQIVPFRGEYYSIGRDRRHLTRTMIYPTPDPSVPFLGVHFTSQVDGSVIVGPNAVVALGREAYGRFDVDVRETVELLRFGGFWRLLGDADNRRLALSHLHTSVRKGAFVDAARRLVPAIRANDLEAGHAGIRAQLVHRDGSLVMEPRIETGQRSTHVLNAVSPGLTTSLPFGEHVADGVLDRLEDR